MAYDEALQIWAAKSVCIICPSDHMKECIKLNAAAC